MFLKWLSESRLLEWLPNGEKFFENASGHKLNDVIRQTLWHNYTEIHFFSGNNTDLC